MLLLVKIWTCGVKNSKGNITQRRHFKQDWNYIQSDVSDPFRARNVVVILFTVWATKAHFICSCCRAGCLSAAWLRLDTRPSPWHPPRPTVALHLTLPQSRFTSSASSVRFCKPEMCVEQLHLVWINMLVFLGQLKKTICRITTKMIHTVSIWLFFLRRRYKLLQSVSLWYYLN